jgi:hypothetical protein
MLNMTKYRREAPDPSTKGSAEHVNGFHGYDVQAVEAHRLMYGQQLPSRYQELVAKHFTGESTAELDLIIDIISKDLSLSCEEAEALRAILCEDWLIQSTNPWEVAAKVE